MIHLYRYVAGVRLRYCSSCAAWKVHSSANFHAHAARKFGLQTTCAACMRESCRARSLAKTRRYTQNREYAKAAIAGRI